MKNYTGQVLLLEEDYYLAPDIITTLQMTLNLKKKECKDCRMITAGNYDKAQIFSSNAGKVGYFYLLKWILYLTDINETAHEYPDTHRVKYTVENGLYRTVHKV
eukprot:XP_019926673.1 PREDICTED: alpha-1,6-mannosyl-glycoprotein 2-beta-N-acetylglucosaminyltransferase-like [Crassostrea gigas]